MFKVKRRLLRSNSRRKQFSSSNGSSEPFGSSDVQQPGAHRRGILKTDSVSTGLQSSANQSDSRASESPNSALNNSNHSNRSNVSSEGGNSQQDPSSPTANDNSQTHNPVSNSASKSEEKPPPRPQDRRVTFDKVRVREYSRTLGDNPSCSSGAPMTIGWEHGAESSVSIQDYEDSRSGQRRRNTSLVMTRQAREALLLEWGATIHEIIDAIRVNAKIKHQRRRTVNSIGTYDKWEEAMERAGRKLKKTLRKQKTGPHAYYKQQQQQELNHPHHHHHQHHHHLLDAYSNHMMVQIANESPSSSLSSEPLHGLKQPVTDESDQSDSPQLNDINQQVSSGVQGEQVKPASKAEECKEDTIRRAALQVVAQGLATAMRPTPIVEFASREGMSCASSFTSVSMLDDEFFEDGNYDDFRDLLDPYISDDRDLMYPSEVHISSPSPGDDNFRRQPVRNVSDLSQSVYAMDAGPDIDPYQPIPLCREDEQEHPSPAAYSVKNFELLVRNQSHWDLDCGSCNSGPNIKRVVTPVVICEEADEPSSKSNEQYNENTYRYYDPIHPIQAWHADGFRLQPPPHSANILAHWD